VQNKWAARRALERNGEQLSASLMIGVKPLDAAHRHAVRQFLASRTDRPALAIAPSPPKAPPRHYHLDATVSKVVGWVWRTAIPP
jgi:nuclear pore complex protein Nup53